MVSYSRALSQKRSQRQNERNITNNMKWIVDVGHSYPLALRPLEQKLKPANLTEHLRFNTHPQTNTLFKSSSKCHGLIAAHKAEEITNEHFSQDFELP